MIEIRSNLHVRYAGSFPFDYSQEQVQVELLSFPGLAIHDSGFNCGWLKAVVVEEVIVFLAFSSLSLSCCNSLAFVVAMSKGIHYPPLSWLILSLNLCTRSQKSIYQASFHSLSIWWLQGKREIDAGYCPFENGVNDWMSVEAACVSTAGEFMEP